MARASIIDYGWEDVGTKRHGSIENLCRGTFNLGHGSGEVNEWVRSVVGE